MIKEVKHKLTLSKAAQEYSRLPIATSSLLAERDVAFREQLNHTE